MDIYAIPPTSSRHYFLLEVHLSLSKDYKPERAYAEETHFHANDLYQLKLICRANTILRMPLFKAGDRFSASLRLNAGALAELYDMGLQGTPM